MAAKSANRPDIDSDLILRLADLLEETGLSEIEYGIGDFKVRVARQAPGQAGAPAPAAPAPPGAAAGDQAPGAGEVHADHPGVVVSPMVGVVYTSPDSDTPPFVKVGDTVDEGDTLLLIEAMKVFNQIKAPRAGKVAQILIGNGTPVEFGEPLMIID